MVKKHQRKIDCSLHGTKIVVKVQAECSLGLSVTPRQITFYHTSNKCKS